MLRHCLPPVSSRRPTAASRLSAATTLPTNVREELVRIDHQFSDKFWVFGHYVHEQAGQNYGPPMWSGVNVPTVGNTFANPSYTYVVHGTYAISPTLLSETAFNADGNRITIAPTGADHAPRCAPTFPKYSRATTATALPGINISGHGRTTMSPASPGRTKRDDIQFREDVSWTKGSHQMKMGASWAKYAKIQDLFGNTQGAFGFNGSYTGSTTCRLPAGLCQQLHRAGVAGQRRLGGRFLGCVLPGQLAREQPPDPEPRPALGWHSAHL